ncbi:MAG: 3-isopropylmalate dehydratase small subunit [Candidatus Aenigmarchaeota archaeon]|nr:3-isopropylmalate dehydratase small subunit [Candidatus Aenigmarchaeota archaeon]
MMLKGKAHKFGDFVNTDLIIPFRFKSRTNDPYELAKYAMYGIDPEFPKKVRKGNFIVAGENFGGGSSREQAPIAIKYCGIAAVIAESFARIFFRNAIAIGLPALEIPGITKEAKDGDALEIDLKEWTVKNLRTGRAFQAKKVSGFLEELQKAGGLVEYYRKNKRFPWE